MSKKQVKGPGHASEIECLDQQARVTNLPAATAAHEAPQLLAGRPSLPRRLLLEGAEGAKIALSVDDLFHGSSAEGADQLVLQVCDAHIEAESLHVGSSEVGAEAGPLEAALEVALLSGVAETGKPDVEPARAEPVEEAADRLRAAHRHEGDALGAEIPVAPLGQRFQRDLVADSFHQHDPSDRLEQSRGS